MRKLVQNSLQDVSASIVVLLVALPLCLGIALGSNAPLFAGIIAGVVGGVIVGLLSGSPLSVSGPAAGLTVIVASGIASLGDFNTFLLAVVIAGGFQILLGFLKAGVIGDYIPNSVIKGMLAAIGLILILKQFPHLVGYDVDYDGDMSFQQKNDENTFTGIFHALNYVTPVAALIGITSLLILVVWDGKAIKESKALSFLPGPLVVVVVGTLVNGLFAMNAPEADLEKIHLVALPRAESFQEFKSFFTSPNWDAWSNYQVWLTAFTLAIVASLETLLGIEAVDKLDPFRRVSPPNRELKAQGVGNLISGLLGGLPITSVIVRSSANVAAGAKSKNSAILHGVFLALCVAFIPGVLNMIPLSALAAILIYTGYKLAKFPLFTEYYRKGLDQFVPFIVTIVAILFTDLLKGIVVGIAVGILFMLRSNFRTSVLMVNDGDHYLIRFRKDVSFLNKPLVKKKLEEVPNGSYLLIDATRADFIDKDVIEEVNNFMAHAHLKNIQVEVKRSIYKPVHLLFHKPSKLERL